MELADIIPLDGIPKTSHASKGICHWVWPSEKKKFETLKENSPYTEEDIIYHFNSYGYRCQEFDEQGEIVIVAGGCSLMFGLGLPAQVLAFELVRAEIERRSGRKTLLWNLSCPGASNDSIARTLALSIPVLKPHIVLVGFTRLNRREYVTVENAVMPYIGGHNYHYDPVFASCAKYFDALLSKHDDLRNLFINYLLIDQACRQCCSFFSFPNSAIRDDAETVLPLERCAGVLVESDDLIDVARDGYHPGPSHHRRLAEGYLESISRLGGLGEL